MANFETFLQGIKLSANLLFLKSEFSIMQRGLNCQRKIMEGIQIISSRIQQGKNTLGSSWFIKSSSYHRMRCYSIYKYRVSKMDLWESKLIQLPRLQYQNISHNTAGQLLLVFPASHMIWEKPPSLYNKEQGALLRNKRFALNKMFQRNTS